MPETFLILLAGGIMLAAAVSRASQVTLNWLRLCGILALAMAGIALFFYFTRDAQPATLSPQLRRVQLGLLIATVAAILAHLAFVQLAFRRTQRFLAGAAFAVAVLAGTNLLHELMIPAGTAVRYPPKTIRSPSASRSTLGRYRAEPGSAAACSAAQRSLGC